jgi:surface antigen
MKGRTSKIWKLVVIIMMVVGACLIAAPSGQDEITAEYIYGQCTWWAWYRAGLTHWSIPETGMGDGGQWDNSASYHHLQTGSVPIGGSIAVWEATNDPAGALGHVGFVERVNEDGTILITEYNYPLGSGKKWTTFPNATRPMPDHYIYPNHPIVYEHANFAGKWTPVKTDINDLTSRNFEFGDGENWSTAVNMGGNISSVWVPYGWSVVLLPRPSGTLNYRIFDWSDDNFAGDTFWNYPWPPLNDNSFSLVSRDYSCAGVGGSGLSANMVFAEGETAQNVGGEPVPGSLVNVLETMEGEVSAQTYSGICGTGPTNPTSPSNPPSIPDTSSQWQLTFYNNEGTTGSPVWTGTDGSGGISHNWGSSSPASGVNTDHFSARWERDVNFPTSGNWKFTIRSDDGFRIFIDGELFSHEWSAGWHDISPSKYLTAGVHRIRLDYFEAAGDARVEFGWSAPPNNDGGFHGNWQTEWFSWDNLDPSRRTETTWESSINYDWGTGSPGHGLGPDNFSARWTGTFYFDEDWFYKFPVKSDDGFKLWIDGQLVGQEWYEGWHDVAPDRRLSAGNHQVVYEYFEKYGGANTRLTWYKLPPDTTPPVGQVIQPAAGITINANQVKICAQVEDAGVGLGTVQFQLYHLAEPNAWRVLGNDDDGRDGYCKTWDHSQWPDEEINTYIFAWDRAGNMLSGGGNTFRIDRTAPTGSFTSPTSNSTITTDSLTIRVNANDNLSNGVDRVEFQGYYDAGNNNLGWWPMTVDSTGADGWGFDWDLSDLPNQTITMRATIYDKAGNSRTIEANNVTLVPHPPSENVELTTVSTQVNGEYRTEFNPGESFSLWIGATNHVAEPVDTLWTWEVTNPNGSVNGYLSWKDFPVSMSPGANAWALNRTAPTTPGTYTFVGTITWGDGQYQSQKSMTFRVAGSSTIYLPIIVK